MSERPTSAFGALRAELVDRRQGELLAAAHEAEFLPDGEPASEAVQHALAAACHEGMAIGLAVALALLEEIELSNGAAAR